MEFPTHYLEQHNSDLRIAGLYFSFFNQTLKAFSFGEQQVTLRD